MIYREVPKDGLPVIQARDHIDKSIRLKADVVIVGSGAGGSVLAFELANAGRSVIILEAGPYVPSSEFTENMADTIDRIYVDGALQANTTYDVPLFQGACIGGSTVIDATIAFRAPDHVLESWEKEHGLKGLAPEKFRSYFDRVEQRLNVHINEPHEINECASKVIQGCESLGWSWKPLARTVKQCALTGHCLSGCASDRKQSALVTYLPWAIASGARLYSDTYVWQILTTNGRASGVLADVVDPQSKEKVAELRVDAQMVVVAAGAIQTPLLLEKSGMGNTSGWLGRNLSVNPFVGMLGKYPDPVYGWRGAMTGVYVDELHDEKNGYALMESGLAHPVQMLLMGGLGVADGHMEFFKDYRNYAALNVFVHDEGQGYVRWSGDVRTGNKKIDWNLSKKNFEDLTRAIRAAGRIFFASGAERVYLPTYNMLYADSVFELDKVIEQITFGALGLYSMRVASLHPQGTCRMGMDPFESVVSPTGELHDVKGVFVADASLLPSEVTVNPRMTVYALASYIADQIIQNQESYFWSNKK